MGRKPSRLSPLLGASLVLERFVFPHRGAGASAFIPDRAGLPDVLQELTSAGRRPLFLTAAASSAAPAWAAQEICDDACLSELFGNFKDAKNSPLDENDSRPKDAVSDLYGTITPAGVRAVMGRLDIRGSDVFTDLGSGIGNIVLQWYSSSPVRKARGIEFVKSRHAKGLQAVRDFEAKFGRDSRRELLLVNGDMTAEDYSDSTIIFANSVAFYPNLVQSMQRNCEANPRLRYLVTFRPLENTTLRFLGEIRGVQADFLKKGLAFKVYSNAPGVELRGLGT